MANHCFEVICSSCGAEWCDLGCNYDHPPSQDNLNRFMKNAQEWADKFADGNINKALTKSSTSRCHHCKISTTIYLT